MKLVEWPFKESLRLERITWSSIDGRSLFTDQLTQSGWFNPLLNFWSISTVADVFSSRERSSTAPRSGSGRGTFIRPILNVWWRGGGGGEGGGGECEWMGLTDWLAGLLAGCAEARLLRRTGGSLPTWTLQPRSPTNCQPSRSLIVKVSARGRRRGGSIWVTGAGWDNKSGSDQITTKDRRWGSVHLHTNTAVWSSGLVYFHRKTISGAVITCDSFSLCRTASSAMLHF